MPFRRKPKLTKVQLAGIQPTIESLYDGSMLSATAAWWNEVYDAAPQDPAPAGYFRFTPERRAAIAERVLVPENRDRLASIGEQEGAYPQEALAGLGLAYALALTISASTASEDVDEWARGLTLSREDVEFIGEVYGPVADYVTGAGVASPYWHYAEMQYGTFIVSSAKWAYQDQVQRWEKAVSLTPMSGALTFTSVEAGGTVGDVLFEWAGRFFDAERGYPFRTA